MSDNIGAYHLMPPGRSIIVADRGYDDTQLWRDWDSRGICFIVRLRKDIKFTRKEAFAQPDDREQDILVDEAVELVGVATSKNYPHPLRRVVVYRPYGSSRRKSGQTADVTEVPEHTIELITNNAHWEADTISALYKSRWHMSNLVTFIRIHLMSYIDLWTWMNQLVDKAHSPPNFTQT